MQDKKLREYCKRKLLTYEINSDLLYINDKVYEIVERDTKIFDEDFEMAVSSIYDNTGVVYEFCGRWYLQDFGVTEPQMDELIYVGKSSAGIDTNTFLGVHTGHELLNGVGTVQKWVKKAKFLGVKNLGICERKNLSGVLDFQKECINNDIKPITGISVPVREGNITYIVKIYAKNFQGWQTLLKINQLLNVDEQIGVTEQFLEENLEDVFIVVDSKFAKLNQIASFIKYYSIDTTEFVDEDKDAEYLNCLKEFLQSDLKPVLLNDAYNLEQEDWEAREKLWGVAKSFDYKSKNQYFKSHLEAATEFKKLFDASSSAWREILVNSIKNADHIANECNFIYDTTSRHLPKYEMTEGERSRFNTNEDFFLYLINEGLNRKIKGDQSKYIERINKEVEILRSGDVIDYFLLTRDIANYAKSNGVLLGVARGSAGGCLVSYLLDITEIDPLKYGLIFERFLNKGRMGDWTECDAYEIETDNGTITLNEKSLLKVLRDGKEINIFVETLRENDEIINY